MRLLAGLVCRKVHYFTIVLVINAVARCNEQAKWTKKINHPVKDLDVQNCCHPITRISNAMNIVTNVREHCEFLSDK